MIHRVISAILIFSLIDSVGSKASFGAVFCVEEPCCYDPLAISPDPLANDEIGFLAPKKTITVIGCRRGFEYRGKLRPLDSKHQQDAEGLRTVMQKSQAGLSLLDEYQINQSQIRFAAYSGTIGLILALTGVLLKSQIEDPRLNAVKNSLFYGGLAVGGISLGYSMTLQRSNENKLSEATKVFNQENPNDEIRLNFETEISF